MERGEPRPGRSASKLRPYWEPQQDLHCGRHALNMILGHNAFATNDIDHLAREVDLLCRAGAGNLEGYPGQKSVAYIPCATGGNWDADVLLKALNSRPGVVTAEYAEQQMPPPEIYAATYIGTLVHRAAAAGAPSRLESRGGHYTCFRKIGDRLYHLDSLDAASANHAISLRAAQRLAAQPGANCWHVYADGAAERPYQGPQAARYPKPTSLQVGAATNQPPKPTTPSPPAPPPATPAPASGGQAVTQTPSPDARVARAPRRSEAPKTPAPSTQKKVPGAERRDHAVRKLLPGAPDAAATAPTLECRAHKRTRSKRRRPRRKKRGRNNALPTTQPAASGSNGESSDPGRSVSQKKAKTNEAAPRRKTKTNLPQRGLDLASVSNLLRELPREFVLKAIAGLNLPAGPQPASTSDEAARQPDNWASARKRPRRRTRFSCDFESIPEEPDEEAAAEEEAEKPAESPDVVLVPDETPQQWDPPLRQAPPGERAQGTDLPASRKNDPARVGHLVSSRQPSAAAFDASRATEYRRLNLDATGPPVGEAAAKTQKPENGSAECDRGGQRRKQTTDGGDRQVAEGGADIEDVSDSFHRPVTRPPDCPTGDPSKPPVAEAYSPEEKPTVHTPQHAPTRNNRCSADADPREQEARRTLHPRPGAATHSPKREVRPIPQAQESRRRGKCPGGSATEPCIFSRKRPGAPARRRYGHPTCFWCSAALPLAERLSLRSQKRYLRAYQTFPPDAQARALSRMRPNLGRIFLQPASKSGMEPGQRGGKTKREPQPDPSTSKSEAADALEDAADTRNPGSGPLRPISSSSVVSRSTQGNSPAGNILRPTRHPPGLKPPRERKLKRGSATPERNASRQAGRKRRVPTAPPRRRRRRRRRAPAAGDCPGPTQGVRCFYSFTDPGAAARLSTGCRTCWWCSLAHVTNDAVVPNADDGPPKPAPPGKNSNEFDVAVAHVFYNFPPRVQRQARNDATRPILDSLQRTRGLCRGARLGDPCEFSTTRPGFPVRVAENVRCMCCRADFATRLRANKTFFSQVRRRVYLALQPAYRATLLQRVPENLRAAMAADPTAPRGSWASELSKRQTLAVYTDVDHANYRAHVLNDQRRARHAFSFPKRRLRRGASITNATTLPVARIPIARAFERWCEVDSWAVCRACARVQPRDITQRILFSLSDASPSSSLRLPLLVSATSSSSPSALRSSSSTSASRQTSKRHSSPSPSAARAPRRVARRRRRRKGNGRQEETVTAAAIDPKDCTNCSARRPHEIPAPQDVPLPLRNLAEPILTALSPLKIYTGPLVRANVRKSSIPGNRRHDHLATGYRQHTSMIRFAWRQERVDARIAALKTRRLRKDGEAALAFLKASRDSDYHEFYREHKRFLRQHADLAGETPDTESQLLSLPFLERPGLECALWPHLFWRREFCFSHERFSDPRRGRERWRPEKDQNRPDAGQDLLVSTPPSSDAAAAPRRSTNATSSDSRNGTHSPDPKNGGSPGSVRTKNRASRKKNASKPCRTVPNKQGKHGPTSQGASKNEGAHRDDDGPDAAVRHSAKNSFAAKALGPLLTYGSSFEILQYVYDLTMWSSIGSKRTVGDERVPLRLMMKGYPFNPLYWRSLHLALVDMVRQLGPPVLFWTFAPYEWSFPYHIWIRDAMSKQLRGRLFLPLAETLHLAHVMSQLVRGLLTGRSHGDRREGGRWTAHLLAARDPASGRMLDLPFFARLEFQDGTRKAATQDYHGSGRPHVHVLVFCDHPQLLPLNAVASATIFDDRFHPALKQYILGSQRDQFKDSVRNVSLDPTHYDRVAGSWRLYHSPKDKAAGLRAFFPTIMDSLKCHQDLQVGTGKGLLAAYVAKYVSKFSSSALDEWLSDYLEANAVAANFLYRYKPFEPEMILQIFGQRFRQWDISTDSRGKRDFRVPLPGAAVYPAEITQYVKSEWRSETTSLLDFLRKTNNAGKIAGWLRQKYKKEILLSPDRPAESPGGGYSAKTRRRGSGKRPGAKQGIEEGERAPQAGKEGRAAETGERTPKRRHEQTRMKRRQGKRSKQASEPGAAVREDRASGADSSTENGTAQEGARVPPPESLASFASRYRMRGEQVVAADTHSRLGDTFYGQWMMLHVPFRNPEALLNRDIIERVPKHLKFLANALFSNNELAEKFWRNEFRVTAEMESEGFGAAQIESTLGMIRANRELIADYVHGNVPDASLTEENDARTDERERQRLPAPTSGASERAKATEGGIIRAPLPDMADLNSQQRRFVLLLNNHMEMSANVANLRSPEARESHMAHLRTSKVVVCTGPPGTGKTTAARLSIQTALGNDGQVLLALPTAQLASNLRTYYVGQKNVVIDTCAAVFGLMEDPCESLPHLSLFALIMVDEFSQLSKIQFERIVKLWASADKLPALVFCGDPYQMSGFGNERPWHSRLWRKACNRVHLVQAYRCKDPQFWARLSALRVAKPSEAEVRELCAKRKAWHGYPDVRKMRRHLKRFPQTTILTCTRRGTHVLNNLVLRAKFPRTKPLTHIPGDLDSNPENYTPDGSMKPASERRSLWIPIFVGMEISITQNVRKEADFVNGMVATVECFYPASAGLRVLTATGSRFVIFKWKNPREPEIPAHYPIRPGYASTIMKYQGAELSHVTVYLDARHVPGAAYTALSRVQSGRQYRLAGKGNLDPDHFTPADVTGLT